MMPLVTEIRADTDSFDLGLRRVWQWRGLLRELLVRNILIRYRVPLVGALWAVAQPMALRAGFSLVLHHTVRPGPLP